MHDLTIAADSALRHRLPVIPSAKPPSRFCFGVPHNTRHRKEMMRRKNFACSVLAASLAATLAMGTVTVFADTTAAAQTQTSATAASSAIPAGMYASELTGEPVSTSLQNQRPVAVMIDNDERALPHYGMADADIVYELENSTLLSGITRLMCVYKDWNSLSRVGNIRSTRPTNIMLASELNAVLIHDGGPFYNNPYITSTGINHLSGGFTRINNGKAREFTEYVTAGEAAKRMAAAGYSRSYTAAVGNHFNFTPYGTTVDLKAEYPTAAISATTITLPHDHDNPKLVYNAATGMYDYYQYGKQESDGGTGKKASFKNVFIQSASIHQYDKNGYLIYNCIGGNQAGFYCTGGYAVPVFWTKPSETGKTIYIGPSGSEIVVNDGKSYVTLIDSTKWGRVGIK